MVKKYDKQYQDYQSEVQSYLKKVKDGRRVPAADPHAPQFSQSADDERQARRAGLGSFIRQGPPAPQLQQQQMPQQQPAAPPPGVTAAPSRVWGFHEPTVDMGAGVEQGLSHAGKVLADPRNAWMGLGAAGGMVRMSRAEILRNLAMKESYDKAKGEVAHLPQFLQQKQLQNAGQVPPPGVGSVADLNHAYFPETTPNPKVIDSTSRFFEGVGNTGQLSYRGRQDAGETAAYLNEGYPPVVNNKGAWTRGVLKDMQDRFGFGGEYGERVPTRPSRN